MTGADSHKRTHTVVALDEVGRRLGAKTGCLHSTRSEQLTGHFRSRLEPTGPAHPRSAAVSRAWSESGPGPSSVGALSDGRGYMPSVGERSTKYPTGVSRRVLLRRRRTPPPPMCRHATAVIPVKAGNLVKAVAPVVRRDHELAGGRQGSENANVPPGRSGEGHGPAARRPGCLSARQGVARLRREAGSGAQQVLHVVDLGLGHPRWRLRDARSSSAGPTDRTGPAPDRGPGRVLPVADQLACAYARATAA